MPKFQIETLPITSSELVREMAKDGNLEKLLQGLQKDVDIEAKYRFNMLQIEFTLKNNCILRNDGVVIPESLRYQL